MGLLSTDSRPGYHTKRCHQSTLANIQKMYLRFAMPTIVLTQQRRPIHTKSTSESCKFLQSIASGHFLIVWTLSVHSCSLASPSPEALLCRTHNRPTHSADAKYQWGHLLPWSIHSSGPSISPCSPDLADLAQALVTSGQQNTNTENIKYGNTDQPCRSWVFLLEAPSFLPSSRFDMAMQPDQKGSMLAGSLFGSC